MLPDNAIFSPHAKAASSTGNQGGWLPMMYLNEQGNVNIAGIAFFAVSLTMVTLTIIHHWKSIQKMKEGDSRMAAIEQELKELKFRKGIA